MPVDIKVKVTVKNRLTTLPKSRSGLFKVKMYFSSDGDFDPTAEDLTAQLDRADYTFPDEIPARTTASSVWLIGTVYVCMFIFPSEMSVGCI